MKNAIYCRVSTAGQTTDNQKMAVSSYCDAYGLSDRVVYEDTISGAKQDRAGLNQLKEDVTAGLIKTVIVWKLDRLARSTMHLLETLNFFRENNVSFISVTEHVDTSSPAGKMLITFLGAIAEFERELIRERIMAGLERARANNIKLGRKGKEFDIQQAVDLRKQGYSYREIAEKVNGPKSSVYRCVSQVLSESKTF